VEKKKRIREQRRKESLSVKYPEICYLNAGEACRRKIKKGKKIRPRTLYLRHPSVGKHTKKKVETEKSRKKGGGNGKGILNNKKRDIFVTDNSSSPCCKLGKRKYKGTLKKKRENGIQGGGGGEASRSCRICKGEEKFEK